MVGGKGGTILIVEDDPGVARLQQRRLERAGYTVVSAGTAEEGMQKARQGGVELVLLDYRLPGDRTGLDVYAQLKATGHDVPVILVTGFSDEATVIQALRAGVRDFVTKSVEYLDYLPEAVERVLRQVRTEHQLAQSEARLAGVISSAMDAILTVDADQRITLFNAAAEQIFRCPAAQALGQAVCVFIPATADGSISLFGRSSEKGHLCATWLEVRGVRADGQAFPLEASLSSAQVGGQKFCIVIVRDITERKQAEERLREQAALLDRATNAIFVSDLEDHVRFWNHGAERLYGWTAADAFGRKACQFLFREASPALDEARKVVLEKGEWSGELHHVTKEGKEVIVESHWTLVGDEQVLPRNILVIETDITEKKKLEAQFLRAQRMESIGTLAGGIAHDLNNVLTPILMAVDLLQMVVPESARESLLAPLKTSAERGAEMVKQVLSFARGVEGQRGELQLKHVVRDLEKMLRHTLPKGIDIRTSLPPNLWTVSGDATQLYQVLMNLCVNARDAMPAGGRLTLTAENVSVTEQDARVQAEARPGPHVLFTVADTGTGIPADILDNVFDPFFTTKEQGKGTGLGLSTVLGIVNSHGGFIRVDSEVGKGTRFAVFLPAAASAHTQPVAEAGRTSPDGNGELILVVDDEASIREIAKAILQAHGYGVVTASVGTEAVALYAEHRGEIQAVLTDMMMPVMNGPAIIRALRGLNPDVRIIAMSGLASDGAGGGAGLDVQALLPKPYTADKLLITLREVLDEGPCSDLGPAIKVSAGRFDQQGVESLTAYAGMS